jgi:thioredoxin
MSTPAHVTEGQFQSEVLQSPLPVLADFYATWCGPCRMQAPILEQLAAELAGKVKVVKVNIDDEPGLAETYRIRAVPTLVIFRNGAPADRIEGLASPALLRQRL